ncbi:hypothetical protein PBI_ANJALI_23 [Arthrobacter phage Anjali]|uniref:Uncharacterized protein n=1 Tax=Arthrobacter phage Anjali TaxID=2484217 RepID=A0A3G3LYT5_9CAUD|nr:hypothetical protein HWB95_gp23 [Arthrobacter phage Anjali]AYQ98993.1 hypothetical protein PBI_ANJALI_23 [Arthrobacter phage Anjali]
MFGFILWAILFASIMTTGIYAIDAGTTAEQPPIGRHRAHF